MSTPSNGDIKKPLVPKFSSFKSSTAGSDTSRASRAERRSPSPKHRERPSEHRHRSKRQRRSNGDDTGMFRGRSPREDERRLIDLPGERSSSTPPKQRETRMVQATSSGHGQAPQPAKHASGAFVYDVKGDPLLKRYGDNGRYRLPYRLRCLPGRVLGTEGRIYIHRDGFREQFTVLAPGEKLAFYRDKDGLRSKRPATHPRPIRLRASRTQNDNEDEDMAFLPIRPAAKRKPQGAQLDSSDSEEEPSFRSIEGKMKSHVPEEDASDTADEVIADLHDNNPLRWRSVQLNRQVKESPEDIQAWLDLVDHQDVLLEDGHDIDHLAPVGEAHSYGEIKLSLLENALRHATQPKDHDIVLGRLMREGLKIWSPETALKRWDNLSEAERGNFDVWIAFADHQLSDMTSFDYEKVRGLFADRLRTLKLQFSTSNAHAAISEAIFVLLRLTRLIADAGYRELAISSWQALFETTFFRPKEDTGLATSFGEFWESEVPRIGEQGATGWRRYAELGGEAPEPQPASTQDAAISSRDPYKVWAATENDKEREARVPARTMDEGNDDDPYRVVVFSDLEPLFFMIPEKHVSSVRNQLIDSLLVFSGLPTVYEDSSWIDRALKDPYLTGVYSDIELPSSDDDAVANTRSRSSPKLSKPMLQCRPTVDILLSDGSWFQYLPSPKSTDAVDRTMVERILCQLALGANIGNLGSYVIALSQSSDPGNVKKQAKALLKRYPSDAELYKAYALAEYANGNIAISKKVLASAASVVRHTPALKCTLAWMHLNIGNKDGSLRSLCSWTDPALVDDSEMASALSTSHVLKASKAFRAGFDNAIHTGCDEDAAVNAECLVLLSYLTVHESTEPMSAAQGSITAAMDMLQSRILDLKDLSQIWRSAGQVLLQEAARLLYWHACHGPFRRGYLRQHLANFLDLFPNNGIFVALLEWSDSSLRVIDDTRDIIYTKCLSRSQDCVSNRILAIQHEMDSGNANSTRTAFEHAVASDACKASVAVWIWYIRFCYSEKSLKPKAKAIFHRALKQCPWSKRVMMQAFVSLIRSMESDELRSVYKTMISKGMRVHVELDEIISKHHKKK